MRGVLGQLGSSSSEAVKICRLGLGHGSVEAADAFTLSWPLSLVWRLVPQTRSLHNWLRLSSTTNQTAMSYGGRSGPEGIGLRQIRLFGDGKSILG